MKNKLTQSQTEEAILLFQSGSTLSELAQKYDTSKYLIRKAFKSKGFSNNTGRRKKYKINEGYFDNIDTEEKAYWLGFIYADGYVTDGLKRGYKLSLSVAHKDCEHIDKFKQSISSNHKTIIISAKTVIMPSKRSINRTEQHRLDIYNKKLWQSLSMNGIKPKKSKTCSYPSNIPQKLQKHFIRGYFDGDGSIMRLGNGNIGMCIIGSDSFINSLSSIIPFSMNIVDEKRVEGMSYLKSRSKKVVGPFLNWMYSNSTIYLDRKYDLWQERFSTTTTSGPEMVIV